MRPIDADAFIKWLDVGHLRSTSELCYSEGDLKVMIDMQPTIDQYRTWIPCSERLPNKPEFGWDGYLVQDAYIVKPYDAYWNGKCWTDIDNNVLDNIVAWMPLPEPYGEE